MIKTTIEHKFAIGQIVWLIMRNRRGLWLVRKKRGFKITHLRFSISPIKTEALYWFEGHTSRFFEYEKDLFASLREAQAECDRLNGV